MGSGPFEARLSKLKAMLKARKGRDGYNKNTEDIQAEISRLEDIMRGLQSGDPGQG